MLSVKPARHRISPSARYHTGSFRVKLRVACDLRVDDRRPLTIIYCSRGPTPARGGSSRFARPSTLLGTTLSYVEGSLAAAAGAIDALARPETAHSVGEREGKSSTMRPVAIHWRITRCVGSACDRAVSFLPWRKESFC
jgi:hypothetical protein